MRDSAIWLAHKDAVKDGVAEHRTKRPHDVPQCGEHGAGCVEGVEGCIDGGAFNRCDPARAKIGVLESTLKDVAVIARASPFVP